MNIKDCVVLITGAASGLGAATARRFSKAGAKVALLDLNVDGANTLAKELNGLAVECNVADEKSAKDALAKVVDKFGGVQVLVSCAGIAPAARIVGREGPHPLDTFAKVIEVNLIGSFNMMRLVSHQISLQEPVGDDGERGVIINTASVAAFEGQLGQVAYSASKGGVAAMTLPAARELSRFGIRVMSIAPGIMQTPMMSAMSEKVQSSLAASVTFPKRLGTSAEYAQLACHIVENDYLNGTIIRLDGGIRMS